MAEFIFAFHGGSMPEDQAEYDVNMAKWGQWMGGLGDKLKNPGAPVGMSTTVSAKGVTNDGGANPVSGYMLLEAANMDEAVAMSEGCPILGNNGSIEIAECRNM